MKKSVVLATMLVLIPGCISVKKENATHTTRVKLVILDEALDEYRNLVGRYPTELQELVDGPKDPSLKSNWDKPLLPQKSLVDGWGQTFVYTLSPEGSNLPYELYSVGEPE